MVQKQTYLNIKIIITPFLESGIEARIKFVTSSFLNLQIDQFFYQKQHYFIKTQQQRQSIVVNKELSAE